MYEDFQRSYKEIRTEFADAHKELAAAFTELKTQHAVQARDREHAVETYREERERQSVAIAECKASVQALTQKVDDLEKHVDERLDALSNTLKDSLAPFVATRKKRLEFWGPIKSGAILLAIGAVLAPTVGPLLAGLLDAIRHGLGGGP